MDKNAIKKYAVWARRELIERVSQRAMMYGITGSDAGDPNAESVNGHLLSQAEKRQRQALIRKVQEKGYEQVMEEAAYTWFNRFAALRFMEVNGYLPSHVRVFTNDAGEFKPQILAEAIHLDLDGLDMKKVYALENANKTEELFKYLLTVQCNALNSILPGMFQRIEDYTELLLPDNLLREGSVIEQMVTTIPEEDWTDQVQIIGWLYQYYISEKKDKVFADLKKNIKITKENIPAATQLFTPDWIVRYMVENSLGRLWLEGHPNDALKSEWKYYLDEAEQEPEVQTQLAAIREEYAAIKPEEIKVIDPCMGSGHILCVFFDVLIRIYEDYGYTAREAAVKIVENNLYGLDIDDRAAQLAYFSVMMKARQYDRRFFSRKVQPHVYATTGFSEGEEYGSLLITEDPGEMFGKGGQLSFYDNEWHVRKLLSQKYDVVVTNPPYMGAGNMGPKLAEYIKISYPDSKSDLSTAFMEKTLSLCKPDGYMAMINIPVWMFLSSYEKLREKLIQNNTFVSMVHPGRGIFGSDFGTTTFTIGKAHIENYTGNYRRLFEKQGEVESIEVREQRFFEGKGRFTAKQSNFSKIPGSPVAYWVSEKFIKAFENGMLADHVIAVKGLDTCDNDTFVRFWHEVDLYNISFESDDISQTYSHKWFPYCKGGGYSKWYGFMEKIVNWENDGEVLRNLRDNNGKIKSRPQNTKYYFKEGLTWSTITSYKLSLRYMNHCIFGGGGSAMFCTRNMQYFFGFINSCVTEYALSIMNPTLNFLVGDILSLPIVFEWRKKDQIEATVTDNIQICKADWDSFETSWDFTCHPLVKHFKMIDMETKKPDTRISSCYKIWSDLAEGRFQKLKANEEELNRIFIDIYGLQNELTPEVEDKDVTVRRADLGRDVRSLISYAVGCMFGRYSIYKGGLVYAGGEWDYNSYENAAWIAEGKQEPITFYSKTHFFPDKDNVIPICDDDYFYDDITGRFINWVSVVYGEETLEENLKFIADALGGKGSSRDVIRNYFLNDFYADHLKIYQKRPIYWLFDSGKKNGFKCLIYMHRYRPDTIARIRTDYVHEQQSRYRTAIADLEQRINGASTSERVKLNKQLQKLQAQAEEIRVYEEKIHHLADQMISIDLDDGVKHNYALFQDVLAKIK